MRGLTLRFSSTRMDGPDSRLGAQNEADHAFRTGRAPQDNAPGPCRLPRSEAEEKIVPLTSQPPEDLHTRNCRKLISFSIRNKPQGQRRMAVFCSLNTNVDEPGIFPYYSFNLLSFLLQLHNITAFVNVIGHSPHHTVTSRAHVALGPLIQLMPLLNTSTLMLVVVIKYLEWCATIAISDANTSMKPFHEKMKGTLRNPSPLRRI